MLRRPARTTKFRHQNACFRGRTAISQTIPKSLKPLEGHRVLFISYNGMLDPLGQTQVLPYLRELSTRGVEFALLSFERSHAFENDGPAKCEELRRQLTKENIEWHWLRYHQTPSIPATSYDVMRGILYAGRLIEKYRIEMVHARSQIPAAIALALKRRFGLKMIFDVRGLMAEEYADAGHWSKGSIPYRLTKTMERRALAAADGVVTLTENIWPIIRDWEGLAGRDVVHEVVPCCADLERFKFRQEDRDLRREELGLKERFVLVYSGSIDGWYLTESMADFFAVILQRNPDAHFLWLVPGNHERVKLLMRERHIARESYTVKSAQPADVPSYLSASDAGVALIKPCFSKIASSPTKTAEYLACGLPIVINAGIGDSDVLITEGKAGVLIRDFTTDEYLKAAAAIEDPGDVAEIRRRSRELAVRLFDVRNVGVERYARLYDRVLAVQTLSATRKSFQ